MIHVAWNNLTFNICLNVFLPSFQLTMYVFTFVFYRFYCQLFKWFWRYHIPDIFTLIQPVQDLKNIKSHCISSVLVKLWYSIASYVLRCLDKVDISDSCLAYLIRTELHFVLNHFSTTFLSLFTHLLQCKNSSILLDAFLKVKSLCLFAFSMAYVYYSHCTTRQVYHHCDNVSHHVTFLLDLFYILYTSYGTWIKVGDKFQ